MSNNPTFGHVTHPETKSNAGTGSTNEGEPVDLNIQECIKTVKHIPLKENPAAPSQLYKCPKDISLLNEKPISDVVTTPGRKQLPQNVEISHKSSLPRPRHISNSIDGEVMKSPSMHIFKSTLNQLLQNKMKPAVLKKDMSLKEFNQRVPKPKGPRPPPKAWGKPAN